MVVALGYPQLSRRVLNVRQLQCPPKVPVAVGRFVFHKFNAGSENPCYCDTL
jgi:hypothetical protein